MPRKTPPAATSPASPRRFNEAAARCRGKPFLCFPEIGRNPAASMRPRPDAAENALIHVPAPPIETASMRPRPDAAENPERHDALVPGLPASMRPRPDAAENKGNTLCDYCSTLLQ